mmetsp:Transcript_3393/g.9738  ORF Transcript_3393/g.9738 Transcript_3393/m.9738 type:complete len:200 (+) Transcript_3393:253-852(+)
MTDASSQCADNRHVEEKTAYQRLGSDAKGGRDLADKQNHIRDRGVVHQDYDWAISIDDLRRVILPSDSDAHPGHQTQSQVPHVAARARDQHAVPRVLCRRPDAKAVQGHEAAQQGKWKRHQGEDHSAPRLRENIEDLGARGGRPVAQKRLPTSIFQVSGPPNNERDKKAQETHHGNQQSEKPNIRFKLLDCCLFLTVNG